MISVEFLSSLEPRPDTQQMMKLLELQMLQEKLRAHLELSQSALKDELEEVRMALQANLAIAEENRVLRNAVAAELGGEWPACWHDPSEALNTEQLWESSFLSLTHQAFPLIHVPTDTDAHDVFTLHAAIEETNYFSGIPEMAREARALPEPTPQMQTESPTMNSTVQRSFNSDESEQRLPGVSVAEEELPDQPWLNSSSVPRTLPPDVTTLVVRNVPAKFSPQKLLEVWSQDGAYNFLHVPYSFERRRRLGMAFINFVSHEAATRFMATWHGQKLADGSRRLQIVAAEIQGLMENLWHLKAAHVEKFRNDNYMPLVFKGTRQLDFRALLAHMDLGEIGNQLEELVLRPATASQE